jgi:DNA-binding SARP family transcriptional activator
LQDDVEPVRPRGNKVWALLAYLLAQSAPVQRPLLANLLFNDAQDPLGALRWNLCQMRRLLPGTAVGGGALRLELEPQVWVDVRWSSGAGAAAEADCASQALQALELDLLAGMAFPSSPAFDEWLAAERGRLRKAARATVHEAAQALLDNGDGHGARALSTRLVAAAPDDESHRALHLRCLAAAGDN